MQSLFKKVILVVLVASFHGSSVADVPSDPELIKIGYYAFMPYMIRKKPSKYVKDLYVSCDELSYIYEQADAFGVAREDVADLAINLVKSMSYTRAENLSEKKIRALAQLIRIANLASTCPNRVK